MATPIGNLRDITLRALDILGGADLIACEDTRNTRKLLGLLGLKAPKLIAYHDHNAAQAGPGLIERLAEGAVVALVSDAGMPLVSDPGYRLVRDCAARAIPVTAIPGASAPLMALQLSALPSDRFLFAGFLPSRTVARCSELEVLKAVPATLIFFESPNRLPESLADMAAVLGGREASVARELTKLHEEVRRGTLAELAAHYAEAGAPRGEVVVVVGPPLPDATPTEGDLDTALRTALAGASVKDAAAMVAEALGLPRRQVYARALELARPQE